jgi:hypothetical protein
MPASSDSKKTGTAKGAKVAIRKWQKDGEREDQDYYHVPGGDKADRKEVRSSTGKGKKS